MAREDNNQHSNLDVFISHSSRDARIAEALVELLRAALDIPADKIRCTSVSGYRLQGGAFTQEQLKQEIQSARLLIGLLTRKSSRSAYVLFELGSRWGAGGNLLPVLALGADAKILEGPLCSYNALRCDDRAQVLQLVDDIATLLTISPNNPPAYEKHVEGLIQASTSRLNAITLRIGLTPREFSIAILMIIIYLLARDIAPLIASFFNK